MMEHSLPAPPTKKKKKRKEGGREELGVGRLGDTNIYIKQINRGDLLCITEICIQCLVIDHSGKEYEEVYIHMCISGSLCCISETNTTP